MGLPDVGGFAHLDVNGNILADEVWSVIPVQLAKINGLDMKTTGATNIFTVPQGMNLLVFDFIFDPVSVVSKTIDPIIGIGRSANYNELCNNVIIPMANGGMRKLTKEANIAAWQIFGGGDVVGINVTTGATATTCTCNVRLIGMLI